MPRGWIDADGVPRVAIHPGEALELPRGAGGQALR
jgi:hypothetical protein